MVQKTKSSSRSLRDRQNDQPQVITAITVQGYKSLQHEERISIAPLTLLAGTNSSGKSSIMQPLLLMKQTLEASYDPGALLLNGPNLKFTSAEQLFTHTAGKKNVLKQFKVGLEINERERITCTFQKPPRKAIELPLMEYCNSDSQYVFTPEMDHEQIMAILPKPIKKFFESIINATNEDETHNSEGLQPSKDRLHLVIARSRCFLEILLASPRKQAILGVPYSHPAQSFENYIQRIIHVPGLRGNPERTYKTTAIGGEFPGTFENYVASIVNYWRSSDSKKMRSLEASLQKLGLTSKLDARQINDTQVELLVGRLPCGNSPTSKKQDMVSIADVGFGVSQTLPILVALLAASPEQLVYIEQPEIHLHPRAQVAMAEILLEAIDRGVQVVVETHSELLLLGIQSLVAEGKLASDKVKLHWFTREDTGATKITSADLDETGAFGDWPEDFGEVSLGMQNRYLSAAEARLWNSK
jgi:hypothetical protein